MRDLTLSSQVGFFLYDMTVLHTNSVLGNQFAHLGPFLVFIDEMGLGVGLQMKICGLVLWAQCSVPFGQDGSHQEPKVSKLPLQKSSTSRVCKGAGL